MCYYYIGLADIESALNLYVGNPGPGLGQAQKCGGVKSVNEIQILPSLIICFLYYMFFFN